MKKLFTLSVISVIAAASLTTLGVHADDSGVTIGGRLFVMAEYVKAGVATDGTASSSQKRLSSNSSFVRFRGTENLGASGLKALWQVETGIRQDGDSATGWATRNSGVGLEGQFGTVIAGQWDTPYKFSTTGADLDVFQATGMEEYQAIIGNSSTTNGNANNVAFDRRQPNIVQYWTPNLAGFSGRVAVAAAESTNGRGNLRSGAVMYRNGPIYLSAAHEIHQNYQNSNKDDKGTRLGASYKIGPAIINGVYERLQYETTTGDIKRNAWFLASAYQIGALSLRGQFGKANVGTGSSIPGCAVPAACKVGNVSNLADSGAKQWTVGGAYSFSKRTDLVSYYTKVDNEKNGTYNFDSNAFNPTPAGSTSTLPGSDRSGFAFGVKHLF